MPNPFKYSAVIYLIIGVLCIFFVDTKKMTVDRLNFLKGVEGRLYELKIKNEKPTVFDLRNGISFYHQLLKVMPNNSIARNNLGYCYFYSGDYKNALKQYHKAIYLEPALYTFYFDMGVIYMALKDYPQAAVFFEKSWSLLPTIKNYYVSLIENLKQKKNHRGLLILNRFVKKAGSDQEKIIENLIKEYPYGPDHNTIMNKENKADVNHVGSLHFFTIEEGSLFEGLKYAAKK